ncbi:N/A [soil metagenome]
MKTAYLIQVHNNPQHLNKLISALDTNYCDFYIHIDSKSKVNFDLPKQDNIHILKDRVAVSWGGFSQIKASLLLLAEAKNNNYDYYVLLSGVDYPLKNNIYIDIFFSELKGKEFIDLYPMPLFDKTFDRVEYFFFEGHQNRFINYAQAKLNYFIRLLKIKRQYPTKYCELTLYAGSQWWALTNNCVEYTLDFVEKNPEFVEFYTHTLCADEMFFQTIIGNSAFKNNVMNACTYTDWTGMPKPAIISKEHLSTLKKEFLDSPFGSKKKFLLFARKFTDQSSDIVDIIDEQLRK